MCGHSFTGTSTDKKATVDGLNVRRRLRCTSCISFFLIELLFPQTKCRLPIPVHCYASDALCPFILGNFLNRKRAVITGRREYVTQYSAYSVCVVTFPSVAYHSFWFFNRKVSLRAFQLRNSANCISHRGQYFIQFGLLFHSPDDKFGDFLTSKVQRFASSEEK